MPILGTSVQVTHKFVSGKADGADGTLVQPSKWNQAENFGAGSDGQALVRDSAASEGASWVDAAVGYEVRGLVGANNAGTPTTKFDLAADLVVLRHASLVHGVTIKNTGTLTNDTGVAGPAANGRDQAGAFSTGIWLHFYFIWGPGQSLATVSSTVAPPTGPTLPTNYTMWAYACSLRYNAGPTLLSVLVRGDMAFYAVHQAVLSLGTATAETSVSLTAVIPPNALRAQVEYDVSATAAANAVARIRVLTGVDFHIPVTGPTNGDRDTGSILLPNVGQAVLYKVDGANMALNLYVQGYAMPNGGE